jgi:YggT family protein
MFSSLLSAIQIFLRILMLLVLADVLVSYFLDPFHRIRQLLDNLIQPLLDPIRRNLPSMGPVDFSPVILLILLQVIGWGLTEILA